MRESFKQWSKETLSFTASAHVLAVDKATNAWLKKIPPDVYAYWVQIRSYSPVAFLFLAVLV